MSTFTALCYDIPQSELNASLSAARVKFDSLREKAAKGMDALVSGIHEPFVRNDFVFNIIALFAFVSSPDGRPLLMYKNGLKENIILSLDLWINHSDGEQYWNDLLETQKDALKKAALEAKVAIEPVQFVYHISSKCPQL